MYTRLLVGFPLLTSNRIQVLLGIDAKQYVIEQKNFQGAKNSSFEIQSLLDWTITGSIKNQRHGETK